MTFRIDVTGSSGAAPAFSTPFFETITLQDGVLSGFGGSTDLTGGAAGGDTLTAGLKGLADLTGAADFSNWDLATFQFTPFPGGPLVTNTQGDIFENLQGPSGHYQQVIDGGSLQGYLPPSQDAAGLADYFRQGMTLGWDERLLDGDFNVVAGYTGTATLTAFSGDASGAPEPAAWALTILGLGAAGASLRRRRAAVLAG
ncbi:MAG TPA: PEP-CTERM sorting domain-containing protein [Phenylobacterium sp.]|uniref:PEP-CTERM sorting domain-containing protein n=1 Tax=Phenylobacterium sp. TaxID=1871053 RepID=UPI002BD6ADB5|nr:PEP-CTERM sorting domain-containing protein [Phenylobacterium sp.]HXA37825.1 PEP-CTERM sorting domain-containing protein [Phenylobacterium sp.]